MCVRPRKYVHPSLQVRASEMDPELRQLGYKKARGQLVTESHVCLRALSSMISPYRPRGGRYSVWEGITQLYFRICPGRRVVRLEILFRRQSLSTVTPYFLAMT